MATRPASSSSVKKFLKRHPGWKLKRGGRAIYVEYKMKDFMAALRFMGRIASRAEKADHHPDLHLTRYRRLRIELYTHTLGRLSGKDLSLAAQISRLPKELR